MYDSKMLTVFLLAALVFSGKVFAYPSVGTEFILAFPYADTSTGGGYTDLIINNVNAFPVAITVNSSFDGFRIIHDNVPARSTLKVNFDHQISVQPNDTLINKGVVVFSSAPVSVFIDEYDNCRRFTQVMVLPTNMLGANITTIPSSFDQYYTMLLVAVEDGTIINMDKFPSKTLNRLDVLQVKANYTSISSTAPIASLLVYVRSNPLQHPAFMSLPAESLLAKEFPILLDPLTLPPPGLSQIIVFAVQDNTQISINEANAGTTMSKGQIQRFTLPENVILRATNPVQVVYEGYDGDAVLPGYVYPPSTFLSSTVQFRPLDHPMGACDGAHLLHYSYILRLLVPLASTGEIQLDGQTIPALQYKRLPLSLYYYYDANITASVHTLSPVSQGAKFMATVFTMYGSYFTRARFVVGVDLPINGGAGRLYLHQQPSVIKSN